MLDAVWWPPLVNSSVPITWNRWSGLHELIALSATVRSPQLRVALKLSPVLLLLPSGSLGKVYTTMARHWLITRLGYS